MQRVRISALTLLIVAGCAFGSTDGEEAVSATTRGICGGGCDAEPYWDDIPSTLDVGERVRLTIKMMNTGTETWEAGYGLDKLNDLWGWSFAAEGGAVAPGDFGYFQVVITAPSEPGEYEFAGEMAEAPGAGFGDALRRTITVGQQQRQWACGYQGGLPPFMVAGTTETVTLQISNDGTRGWPSGHWFCLYSRDDFGEGDFDFWGSASTCAGMPSTVGSGSSVQLTVDITAPDTAGSYQLLRQINDQRSYAGVGLFDLDNHCVDETIEVVGEQWALWNRPASEFVTAMAPGETRIFHFVMENVGSATWPGDRSVTLYSKSTPRSKWGFVHDQLETEVRPGESGVFTMRITAPDELGDHEFEYQLRDLSPGGGHFGESVLFTMTVDPSVTPQFDAEIVSQEVPATMLPGDAAEFRITVRNTGFADWTTSSFGLRSRNNPGSLWGTTLGKLQACLPVAGLGGTCEVVLNAHAPTTPGTYESRWQMIDQAGVSWFGDHAVSVVVVAACGNGVLEGTEVCDDGNNTDGDGCSAACAIEPTWIDLLDDSSDRTLVGSTQLKMFSNVIIADITNDGVPDVIASEMPNFIVNGRGRLQAGRVAVWGGASGFLDGSTTISPDGAVIEVIGAETHDRIGATQHGRIAVADVTGDQINDLIFSTPTGDGPNNIRAEAGEVHVMPGGATLNGFIDMAAPGAALGATIFGAMPGDGLILLDTGDVNGDGVDDLVIGVPGDDTNGVDAGAVVIVFGGGDLASRVDIDLGVEPSLARFYGPVAGEIWGKIGRCGDFMGDGAKDLVIGNVHHVVNGMALAGGAWAFEGPFAAGSVRDLIGGFDQYDARWQGGSVGERLGDFVAVAQVRGDATADVLIGVRRLRDPNRVARGAVDIWTGPVAHGDYDYSLPTSPGTRIWGRDNDDRPTPAQSLGDMNGDGFAEVPVMSARGDGPLNDRDGAGEVQIVRGAAEMPAEIDLRTAPVDLLIYGAVSRDLLGNLPQSGAMGDLDGDDRADLCISSQKGGTLHEGLIDCFTSRW